MAQPGKLSRLELPVARMPTGSWISLPVAVLHGLRPGPIVWLDSAIHGDELNGIPIIRRVLKQVDPRELNGTIVVVPVVNVFGLLSQSRYLPDRRDLNRSFPGSKRGSLASQLAHLFMTEIVTKCDLGLDLHTGSGGRTNLPQVRCDLDDEKARKHARHFAAPLTLHASLRDGSLREAARELGIPVLVFEGGEAKRFDRHAVDVGYSGAMRVLKALGMVERAPEPPVERRFRSRRSFWVRARRSGFFALTASLGARVAKGEQVGAIFDTLGKDEIPVRVREAGIVIGHSSHASVHRGEAVVHVATVEPRKARES